MKYNTLVFDWDGTLINSLERIVYCLQATIKEMNFQERSDVEAKSIIGLGLEEAILALMPEVKASPNLMMETVDTFRRYFFDENIPDSPLFDGVVETLTYLKNKGYILTIATGKSMKGLLHEIEKHQLSGYFELLKTSDQTKSKPDPLMLHETLAELSVNDVKMLMIGDTTFDLEMANNANVDCIGVTTGVHNKQKLEKYSPIAVLNDITELQTIL